MIDESASVFLPDALESEAADIDAKKKKNMLKRGKEKIRPEQMRPKTLEKKTLESSM